MLSNNKLMYGVLNDSARTVERDTEENLQNKGYEYICETERGAYHIIFTRLSIDELQSSFALEIEKKAYGRAVGTLFHDYGDFIKERIDFLKEKESD